jgi:STE24 endopeptidase
VNAFSIFFVIALGATLALQVWLALRHIRYVGARRNIVPESFRDKVPLAAHRKAADYTVTKTRFGLVELFYGTVLLLIWTLGGGLQWLDAAWRALDLSSLWTGVGVIVSLSFISGILELPFTVYRTFHIEQRFGFNRTTPKLFVVDTVKGAALMTALGIPLAWIALWLMERSGSLWWLYVWGVWMGFTLLMMWAYPAIIAPLFNRFSPLENEALKARIEALLAKCGFKSKGVFVMDGSRRSAHGNAYFTGLGNNKRIVFFDTLIDSLEPEEIEAVLAHELGHFRLRHITKRMVSMGLLGLSALALLGWLVQKPWFYSGLGVEQASNHAALVLFMLTMPIFGFFLQPIMARVSRRHEFQADNYAVEHSDGSSLVRALVKLYEENASTLTPDPLYSAFHDTHPPAPVRVANLWSRIHSRPLEGYS